MPDMNRINDPDVTEQAQLLHDFMNPMAAYINGPPMQYRMNALRMIESGYRIVQIDQDEQEHQP